MDSTLPSDVILDEILTRTSPETIAKSRAICKQWNEATHGWSFAEKFHRRTNTASGYFVQSLWQSQYRLKYHSVSSPEEAEAEAGPVPRELSLDFVPGKIIKIEAATKQGLLLCRREASVRPWVDFIVCKPATEQWTEIPKPKTRYFTRKFAMTTVSNPSGKVHYKIARFSEPNPNQRVAWNKSRAYYALQCEIFDSEAWAWRSLPEYIRLPYEEIVLLHDPVVSVGGFFYALTTKQRVFAFDWERESWEAMALPPPLSDAEMYSIKLVVCEGKLGIVCLREFMELWVFEYRGEDRCDRTWRMRKRVNVECLNKNGWFEYPSPLAMYCRDVVVFKGSYRISFFRFGSCDSSKNQILKVVKTGAFNDCVDDLFKIE